MRVTETQTQEAVSFELAKLPKAEDIFPSGTEIPSDIPGTDSRVIVRLPEAAERAQPLVNALLRRISIERIEGQLLLQPETSVVSELTEYFNRNPSSFGVDFMAALNTGDARELARVLQDNHLLLVTGIQSKSPFLIHGVGKIDTVYNLNPDITLRMHGGTWIESKPGELQIDSISGMSAKTPLGQVSLGQTTIDIVTGKPSAYVMSGMSKEMTAAILQNEAQHLEQLQRYGTGPFNNPEHHGLLELVSDAGALAGSDEYSNILIARALQRAYPGRATDRYALGDGLVEDAIREELQIEGSLTEYLDSLSAEEGRELGETRLIAPEFRERLREEITREATTARKALDRIYLPAWKRPFL